MRRFQQVAARVRVDHPAADALLPTAQADLNDLVAFIKAKHIIDLPDAPIAKVVPTPQFARQFTFASMDVPGPLETKATEAYYNVTPVDPKWTKQQAQEHCPKDTVVWLDPQSGLFELKGYGSYGVSGVSRYACRGEAEQAGMRAVPN